MQKESKQFDEQQLLAIHAHDGRFLVLAPPGCGKTDILAERIAVAHEKGVPFDSMLCLTFTNRASRGMRARIAERVGDDASDASAEATSTEAACVDTTELPDISAV